MFTLFQFLNGELQEEVLSKHDLLELIELKLLSKTCRQMIESPTFAICYNKRPIRCAPGYIVAQGFTEDSPNIAILELIRISDGMVRRIRLDVFLRAYVRKEGSISVLAAYGSLILLRAFTLQNGWHLLVFNIQSRQFYIVPRPSGFDMDFQIKEHIRFCIEEPQSIPLRFNIRYVMIGPDSVPRHCCYSFRDGRYSWVITSPLLIGYDDLLDPFDTEHGMILMRPQEALLVSGPFYKNPSLDVVFEELPEFNNPPFDQNDLEPGGGWQHEISKHYGRDGYAVLMLRHTNPDVQHYFRFRAIRLFNIREDWSSYDHVSSVPRRLLRRLPYRVTHECHVEQNGTKVNIIMVVTQDRLGDSDDDDAFDDDEAEEEEEGEGEGEGGVGVADEEGVGVGDLNEVGTNGVGAEDSYEDQDQTQNQDLDNEYAAEDWDDEDEEDIDIDARHWNLMHFIYDIPTQRWTSTFFRMRDYEDVGDPVFTSRLMLGDI